MTEVNKDRQQQTANTLCFVISLYPTARLLHKKDSLFYIPYSHLMNKYVILKNPIWLCIV